MFHSVVIQSNILIKEFKPDVLIIILFFSFFLQLRRAGQNNNFRQPKIVG